MAFAQRVQALLDQAEKLADDGVTLSLQGVIQAGGGKLAMPFTIAVACGPGSVHLSQMLKTHCARDPRSTDVAESG